jgi:hypothetical protein
MLAIGLFGVRNFSLPGSSEKLSITQNALKRRAAAKMLLEPATKGAENGV